MFDSAEIDQSATAIFILWEIYPYFMQECKYYLPHITSSQMDTLSIMDISNGFAIAIESVDHWQ